MAFGLREAIGAAIIGSIIPGVIGTAGASTAGGTGIMDAIKKVGADMFADTLMGKISAGDSPSGVANKYASVDFFDELSASNMGDALATGKAPQAVDPATNDRAMTALLTKMLSNPAYSKQIGV